MIRKLGLVGAIAGIALVMQAGGAWAQSLAFSTEGLEVLLKCELWYPVPGDKAGTQRRIFPVRLPPPPVISLFRSEEEAPGQYTSEDARVIAGVFQIPYNLPLAFWSDPGGNTPSAQFTTRKNSGIFFASEGRPAFEVTSGRISGVILDRRYGVHPSILCPTNDPAEAKLPGREKTAKAAPPRSEDPAHAESKPGTGSLSDLFSKSAAPELKREGEPPAKTEAKPEGSPEAPKTSTTYTDHGKRPGGSLSELPGVVPSAPASPKTSSMAELFKSGTPAIPKPSSVKPVTEGDLSPLAPSPAPSSTPGAPPSPAPGASSPVSSAPADKPSTVDTPEGPSATAVCSTDLKPIAVAPGVAPPERQPVGLRSSQAEVKGFAYVVGSEDVFPADFTFDLADSIDKLLQYEQIVFKDGKLSISIRDLEKKPKSKNEPAAKPRVALRIIVFGGPQEIAISGLDKVGAELKKESKGKVKVDVRWYPIDNASGSLLPARHYDSFGELVEAARKEGTGLAAVFSERQIKTFLDSAEEELKKESPPIDKVFWVKGGYSISSSIPERFERLIKTVSDSGAILRTPRGEVGEWLFVVSQFEFNGTNVYLQVPLQSLVRGKVIEGASGSKQLISDPHALALTLNATGIRRLATAGATPSAPANSEPSIGTPVLDADEVFAQRGYLMSGPIAILLRDHLQDVKDLWIETGAAAINPDTLKDIADKMHKPQATLTLLDVLQDDSRGGLKPLPKLIPDWSRKPLAKLTAVESRDALALVRHYLAGTKSVIEAFNRLEATRVSQCTFLFAPDELFGFRAEPARR